MKTCYAHCILEFDVPDGVSEDAVKQGFLETMNAQDIGVHHCSIEFADNEDSED